MKATLYALAGALAAVLITTTSALAGSGVGGVFNLGQTNTVNGSSVLTGTSPGGPQLKVLNSSATSHGVLVQSAGGGGVALYGEHTSAAGAGPAVRGDSASTASGAFSVYGLLSPAAPAANSAALRGESKSTNANGFGVWGSQAGAGIGVYGTSSSGPGVSGLSSDGPGVLGRHGTTGTAAGVEGDTASTDGSAIRCAGPGDLGLAGRLLGRGARDQRRHRRSRDRRVRHAGRLRAGACTEPRRAGSASTGRARAGPA